MIEFYTPSGAHIRRAVIIPAKVCGWFYNSSGGLTVLFTASNGINVAPADAERVDKELRDAMLPAVLATAECAPHAFVGDHTESRCDVCGQSIDAEPHRARLRPQGTE